MVFFPLVFWNSNTLCEYAVWKCEQKKSWWVKMFKAHPIQQDAQGATHIISDPLWKKEFLTISLASRRVLDKLSVRFGRDNPPPVKAEKHFVLQLLKTLKLLDRKPKLHSLRSATLCFSKLGNSCCQMSIIRTYFHISFCISYTLLSIQLSTTWHLSKTNPNYFPDWSHDKRADWIFSL